MDDLQYKINISPSVHHIYRSISTLLHLHPLGNIYTTHVFLRIKTFIKDRILKKKPVQLNKCVFELRNPP